MGMYFGNVVNLMQAIGTDRGVEMAVTQEGDSRRRREWIVTAHSPDGQLYRSTHSNLLLAVVMLERLLKNEPELVESRI
jgi:hypothetical protein